MVVGEWPCKGIKDGAGIVAMLRQKGRWCDKGHVKHKGRWGIVAVLRYTGRWGIMAMLRHKGRGDSGHVKA